MFSYRMLLPLNVIMVVKMIKKKNHISKSIKRNKYLKNSLNVDNTETVKRRGGDLIFSLSTIG